MIGSLLTRGLVMVLGYAYPAFECYKTVEKNKIEIEELRFWCQYWILVAILTVTERMGDAFISWVPMYSEAKLEFYIYLWYPKGTTYVYDSFFKPYMAKHEMEIDRSLLELRTRAGDMTVIYWQRAASYAQTWTFDVLKFVAYQSTVRPPPAQQDQSLPRTASETSRTTFNAQPESEEPLSPTSSTSSSHHFEDIADVPSLAPKVLQSAYLAPNSPRPKPKLIAKSAISPTVSETNAAAAASQSKEDANAMKTDQTAAIPPEHSEAPLKDEVMDETLRVTRARLRKNRSSVGTAK